jgi:hypothetical protein
VKGSDRNGYDMVDVARAGRPFVLGDSHTIDVATAIAGALTARR